MDPVALLLRTAFRHLVTEANAEAGVARIQELTGEALPDEALHDALAACLRDGLIREPVRLPEGALQCHWRLELTPKGVAAARALLQTHAASGCSAHRNPASPPKQRKII